jgi:hypothetical protein
LTSSHRVIYVAANLAQAHALQNMLSEHGIAAHVTHDAPFDAPEVLTGGFDQHGTSPRIMVHQQDAEEAQHIALDFQTALGEGRLSAELSQLEEEVGDGAGWPACPSCNRPRLTSCPVCETAGTDFPEAFLPEMPDESSTDSAARSSALLVICPTCDEPFAPQFPARCEWCGYRFADGREPPRIETATPAFLLSELNGRVVAVALVLASLAALVMGWFYYILHQSGG